MQVVQAISSEAAPWRRPSARRPFSGPERTMSLGHATIEQIMPGEAWSGEEGGDIRFLFQLRGSALLTLAGRATTLTGRHWCAMGTGGFDINGADDAELIMIAMPAEQFSRGLDAQMRMHRAAPQPLLSAARMAGELARSSLDQADQINPGVALVLGESLVELVKLAVIEQLCAKRIETVRETVRARIEAVIQRHLVDPDLSIDRIAERLQCTKRYLHKVFSDEGQTLSHYIWTLRLERCRADLARADLAARSITEIAFGWGFSNAAHFSRSFRARYGQPPRAYRRMVLGA